MSILRPLHQSIAWSRVFPIASTIVSMREKRFTQWPIGNEPKDVPPGPTGAWSQRMAYTSPLISAVKILFIVRIPILIRPTDQIIPRKKWLCAMLLPQASIPRHTDLLTGPGNCPMVFKSGTQNQETCSKIGIFHPLALVREVSISSCFVNIQKEHVYQQKRPSWNLISSGPGTDILNVELLKIMFAQSHSWSCSGTSTITFDAPAVVRPECLGWNQSSSFCSIS